MQHNIYTSTRERTFLPPVQVVCAPFASDAPTSHLPRGSTSFPGPLQSPSPISVSVAGPGGRVTLV